MHPTATWKAVAEQRPRSPPLAFIGNLFFFLLEMCVRVFFSFSFSFLFSLCWLPTTLASPLGSSAVPCSFASFVALDAASQGIHRVCRCVRCVRCVCVCVQ